ncbi:MAG: glycine--tRNA ligase subunit beta [Alphaproteobacteria bacterium]|nr:MAG: glycine--tRNA ligase subunit beta [Alphaproteobacteria bacterium]
MADFLLELLCEEIPARMQQSAITQLCEGLKKYASEAHITYDAIHGYVTPRRLCMHIEGLPLLLPDQTIERKGPKVNAPAAAIDGFCASVQMERSALDVRTVGKEDVYFVTIHQKGKALSELLPTWVETLLAAFHWQKSMRWADYDHAWVRPMQSILCLLDHAVLPVRFGHLVAGKTTRGHRFMSDGELIINHPHEYKAALAAANVMVDAVERKAFIATRADEIAKAHGLSIKPDAGLLDEVTGLVEYPVPLMGTFDNAYLALPPEVLVLEMRHHQKYFALMDAQGKIAPHFITIANLEAHDGGAKIIAGNQRVLRARLDDGAFYWEQDKKKSLDQWSHDLSSMMFHKNLGMMDARVQRIVRLADYLAPHDATITRAAQLCKADLVTGMVGEFPELQGIMGRYYALAQGEAAEVADAIRDHYLPVGAHDSAPTALISAMIALADKVDYLVSLFAAGEAPTGSKDPFALRRTALGIIKIIRAHPDLKHMSLLDMIDHALNGLPPMAHPLNDSATTIYNFITERLKVMLKDEGIRYDVLEAITHRHKTSIMPIVEYSHILTEIIASDAGAAFIASYKRAYNIVRKAGLAEDHAPIDERLLQQEEERDLYHVLTALGSNEDMETDYRAAWHALYPITEPLNRFFDKVLVNVEDEQLRTNRLQMLAHVRWLVHLRAQCDLLEG